MHEFSLSGMNGVMPRQPRIQYPGALYHIMARGDRRETVFHDDEDRKMFLAVLAEACGRTGWICHGYVLMPNHYHLIIETPGANLVPGMSWLQNTFTRRHTVRHKLWGHLFGGRYKAVLVEPESPLYLPTLIDYVHLNPVRAGLVRVEDGLESFPWSSLPAAYLLPPGKRQGWLRAERGLASRGCADDAAGRRRYLRQLERRAREEGENAGRTLPDGQSLQSTLRRGWVFGTQKFKEKMLGLAEKALKTSARSANLRPTATLKDHSQHRARALIDKGLTVCDLAAPMLKSLPCGDTRKVVIALAVKRETTVPLAWIAEQLHMGTRSTVSRETTGLAKTLESNKKQRKWYQRIVAAD